MAVVDVKERVRVWERSVNASPAPSQSVLTFCGQFGKRDIATSMHQSSVAAAKATDDTVAVVAALVEVATGKQIEHSLQQLPGVVVKETDSIVLGWAKPYIICPVLPGHPALNILKLPISFGQEQTFQRLET